MKGLCVAVINTDEVYKQLKKQNGEAFARVIRDENLLSIPNIVHILHYAGRDATEARKLTPIISEVFREKIKSQYESDKSPLELLSDAGYDAFVVHTEQEKNSIAKYYRPGEKICTLRDPHRHEDYYMIHAIKRGANNIKPSANPERDDEYGTSVISIQIRKTGGFISIKNRYNHTVSDPDNTFNSNPDNIIPGLADSLKKFFHVDFNTTMTSMPAHFRMVHEQLVRYDYEINDFYFGRNYYFHGSTITEINPDNQVLFYNGFLLTVSKGNHHIESIAKDELSETMRGALNEFLHNKKVGITGNKDGTKTILVDGKRFMDVKNGIITFLDTSELKNVKLGRFGIHLSEVLNLENANIVHLNAFNTDNVKYIMFNPDAYKIELAQIKLNGFLDFSGVKKLYLEDQCDLHNVMGIMFNPHAETISLRENNGLALRGNLDFSDVLSLVLMNCDFSAVTDIKFNPKALCVIIGGSGLKPTGDLDFSRVQELSLGETDLSASNSIKFNPNARIINIGHAKLSGDLDFSGVQELTLRDCDLSGVKSIKFNPRAQTIKLQNSPVKISGDVDFSAVRNLATPGCDLSGVTSIKFNSYASEINMENCRGLKLYGDLDFSGVKKLDLGEADLTAVNCVKFAARSYYEKSTVVAGNLGPKTQTDFSHIDYLYLHNSDLKNPVFKRFAYLVSLKGTKLHGDLDFSRVSQLELFNCDLKDASKITFNNSAHLIRLAGTPCKLTGVADFSGVDTLDLSDCDLSDITELGLHLNSSGTVRLKNCKLAGELLFGKGHPPADISGSDLSKVKYIKHSYYPQINGVKSSNLIEFDFEDSAALVDTDLTGLSHVSLVHGTRFEKIKLAGRWDVSDTSNLNITNSDLSKITELKCRPSVTMVQITKTKLAGNLDFSQVPGEVQLSHCDLSRIKSLKFNRTPDAHVYLWESKLAGDLDFMGRDFVALMKADLTQVKSIRLSNRMYRSIKEQEVVMNGKTVHIKDLRKLGVKIITPKPFETAKKVIQDKLSALKSRNIFDKQNKETTNR